MELQFEKLAKQILGEGIGDQASGEAAAREHNAGVKNGHGGNPYGYRPTGSTSGFLDSRRNRAEDEFNYEDDPNEWGQIEITRTKGKPYFAFKGQEMSRKRAEASINGLWAAAERGGYKDSIKSIVFKPQR